MPTRHLSHATARARAAARAAPLVALLATALACAGGDAMPDAAPGDAALGDAPAVAAPDDATPADTAPFAGTVAPTTQESDGPVATLVAVRTAERTAERAAGFERVVLEFADGRLPGHAIAYDADPRACGSGEPVTIAGDARLVVRLSPARAHDDAGRSTIGARDLTPGGGAVRALAISCDFEATVTWVLGLDRRRPYRVLTLDAPARLVVDVALE